MTTPVLGHDHPHADEEGESGQTIRMRTMAQFLEAHFGDVELHMPEQGLSEKQSYFWTNGFPSIVVRLDDAEAHIDLATMVWFFFSNS